MYVIASNCSTDRRNHLPVIRYDQSCASGRTRGRCPRIYDFPEPLTFPPQSVRGVLLRFRPIRGGSCWESEPLFCQDNLEESTFGVDTGDGVRLQPSAWVPYP